MKTERRSLLCWFSFLCCIAVSHDVYAEETLPEIIKGIQPSVVVILTYNQDGTPMGQGSGFFFGKTGDVITNYHVIQGASRAEVSVVVDVEVTAGVRILGKAYPVTGVVAEDIAGDLIRLSIEIPPSAFRPLSVSAAIPEAGEKIVVIGNPLGLEQTATDGIVSQVNV